MAKDWVTMSMSEKRAAGGVQQVDMSWRSPIDLALITNSLYQTPPDLIEAVEKPVPNVN